MDHLSPPPPGPATPHQGPVAVVDDDPHMRRLIGRMLTIAGFRVAEFDCGAAVLAGIDRATSAVCLDLGLDDIPGIEVLRLLRQSVPDVPVIVVTARTGVEEVVEVMKSGAYDYLTKPIDNLRFTQTMLRAAEYRAMLAEMRRLEDALGAKTVLETLAGNSVAMREVVSSVERVRNADVSVAIMGESGTGKEVVARAIHEGSTARHGAFVAVNCASIPHSIQESELFGHEKGAFTGATATHQGKFEQASGGTLFLDEIGEMAPATQASLLRVVQERVIVRVGGRAEIPVDARVICATHRDLAAEVRAGRFREDLYFRLVVYPIRLPPLRDRGDDLPLLVAQLLRRSRIGRDRGIRAVSPEALVVLRDYRWPGNIRELDNVIQRACLACNGKELEVHHLPPEIRMSAASGASGAPGSRRASPSSAHGNGPASVPAWPSSPASRAVAAFTAPPPGTERTLRAIETGAVRDALSACNGNVTQAAKMLGVSRTKLYRDMKKG
jgi:DNA-binding NtrC family response regulator